MVTSTGPWSAALLTAIDLAARWNAHVTGCYVPSSLRDQRACESDPTVMSLLTDGEYTYSDESAAFHAFAKELGAQHTSWVVTHTSIAPTLRKLGAWHDLAVIERDMVGETGVFDILGEGMLSSHVPCLVLPPRWDDVVSFDRIVVGWNGSVEGTRALHSALPLLQLAKQVIVVNGEVRMPYHDQVGVTEPDPIAYLRHHGIAAKPHCISVPAIEAGKSLLQKAHEVRADLLVMGAYGHSRIRERVLGGATRHVMANADIPVFMQH
ncbi:hypothetical protein B0E46_10785 [Rhodanobacter sp. B04]|nr:hypothetical protein B0E46_10785 [Rhodanobacter sp. B04]